MHIGRSHHTALEVTLSLLGGFVASFTAFTINTYHNASLQGQLLAGDPTLNRQMPTTLNAMKGIGDGSDPMISALTSFGWWTAVLIGGVFASFIVFKLMRRYV
jgi:hypothetical protein